MPAHILSAALKGIEALEVDVEVEVLNGLPSFTVVGLTDKSIQESRERITAALTNSGFIPPRRKTIVSLAPGDLRKQGSLYDVPIALGFLCASKQIKPREEVFKNSWFVGELGLDGSVREVNGLLPIVLSALAHKIQKIFIPDSNKGEVASLGDRIGIYPIKHLNELSNYIVLKEHESSSINRITAKRQEIIYSEPEIDISEIAGQEHAKRALLVCASGGHNALLVGPPGTGKTLLARSLAGILPSLSKEEEYIVTSLYSVAGLLAARSNALNIRPFRSPHHGASQVALIGGGVNSRPGEVSLAHAGVLFLDELPEFSRGVLEQLRQPIEDGFVTIARASHSIKYPARSMLIGAMNPCPCGFVGSARKDCTCSPGDILRYQKRISGPMLDRFDLHILVADVSSEDLLTKVPKHKTSRAYALQVEAARRRQWRRQGKTNAELTPKEVQKYCAIDEKGRKILYQAQERFRLSSRGTHRILKVALSIADLEAKKSIETSHLAEALQYREQLKAVLPDFI